MFLDATAVAPFCVFFSYTPLPFWLLEVNRYP